jgi:hypothetical protein
LPINGRSWAGAIGDGVGTRLESDGSLGKACTPVGARPTSAIGTDALVDDGPLVVAGPTSAGPLDEVVSPLGDVGTSPLSAASGPPPDEGPPLKLVRAVVKVPVEPVSRLFGVGTCSPASAVDVFAGAAGSGWFPVRAALATTIVPVAIAAVRIRSWGEEDFRACFDMGGSFSEVNCRSRDVCQQPKSVAAERLA